MNRSIAITSINASAKKQTTTLNYVNPNASDTQLDSLARMAIALTTNTYDSATRIDRSELIAKATPTLTPTSTQVAVSAIIAASRGEEEPYAYDVPITYNGDGELTCEITNSEDAPGAGLATMCEIDGEWNLRLVWVLDDAYDASVTIRSAETSTFGSTSATVTLTA